MTTAQYIAAISQRYSLGNATEHTFRGDLQTLIESLATDLRATNEPKRQACGAPDYILTRTDIPIGFVEAKNMDDKDLAGAKKTGNKEQFDRYKTALNNLIFTDYLEFHWYREGVFVTKIAIATLAPNPAKVGEMQVVGLPENFAAFENLLKDFCAHIGQTIKSPQQLAAMMAGKARLLSDVIEKSVSSDQTHDEDSTLNDQMNAFRDILIHDITPKGFADVYAQTICYGMFAARYHDPTLPTFSRQEAAELIPKSNPFLRKLFGYIAGPDLDDRIRWIVDSLVAIFLACDVATLLKDYGKDTQTEDPIIHFYETFLSEYDPRLRKARGVWYTPAPVVNFMVRAVDDILKTEFDLPQGLADTTKIGENEKIPQQEGLHRLQILDPAAGTGTFLAEVIKQIYQKFEGQQGAWRSYVENHLLPRLCGFELLMASYAMAHLQLDMLLTETGYQTSQANRLKIYLTNSLEESHPDTKTLFATWLSNEANEANRIKRETPLMCIIGNPPYSGESMNKNAWIERLMDDYKKEPGGRERLKERNAKWLNDDYVKFIRLGQEFITKNGSGILAFINPHGFLDNPTFRGMRWNLLKTYDKIYTIDLHGNSKKKETAPDGSPDNNVFDIMQGVVINIFVKTGKKQANELGQVFHYDLYGKRRLKYDFLRKNTLQSVPYQVLPNIAPMYFFAPKNFAGKEVYDTFFSVKELFTTNSVGIVTGNDGLYIAANKQELLAKIKKKYQTFDAKLVRHINYRPFDKRFLYNNIELLERNRHKVMQHFLKGDNVGLVFKLGNAEKRSVAAMVTKSITDFRSWSRPGMQGGDYVAPLYLYANTNGQQSTELTAERAPNLRPEIVQQIAQCLSLPFVFEKEADAESFAPIDILDYIYAVLHSPAYRQTYQEFLKIDFPRVPYPTTAAAFWQWVALGGALRQVHLLESAAVAQYATKYPIDGDNTVAKPQYTDNKVFINDTQYFDNVPIAAWEFYIGGYQPAQKWLKDRLDKNLDFEDIVHYQKMIAALLETQNLMQQIAEIGTTEH